MADCLLFHAFSTPFPSNRDGKPQSSGQGVRPPPSEGPDRSARGCPSGLPLIRLRVITTAFAFGMRFGTAAWATTTSSRSVCASFRPPTQRVSKSFSPWTIPPGSAASDLSFRRIIPHPVCEGPLSHWDQSHHQTKASGRPDDYVGFTNILCAAEETTGGLFVEILPTNRASRISARGDARNDVGRSDVLFLANPLMRLADTHVLRPTRRRIIVLSEEAA
jgi:hypothetical protein